MKQRQHRRTSNKGFALIGSYLALAAVLVYSNLLTMRTMTERRAEQLLQEQLQAFDLAQGALEHLKEKLFEFVREQPSFALPGDVASAYAWIDQLGVGVQTGIYDGLNPLFNPDPDNALALEGVPTSPYPAGPLEVRDLPTLQLTGARAQAWISRVSNIGED
ncbi:MAG: hypothetical protein HY598_01690, partial [Candidatus Omnitrophica bacterium]|nr:hypothetical protein [Candidatus Omnitrophota bacterium]